MDKEARAGTPVASSHLKSLSKGDASGRVWLSLDVQIQLMVISSSEAVTA
jgi:hypothetical protein